MHNADKESDNDNNIHTSVVDSKIAGVAQVLAYVLAYMPINEDRSDASDDDNNKIRDSEESQNNEIPFEDSYHPKFPPKLNGTITAKSVQPT